MAIPTIHSSTAINTGVTDTLDIDVSEISKIKSIVAVGIYSDKEASFLREIVSNAQDSHVEAGTNDPVLVYVNKDLDGKTFITIQDFGVGLSPERYEKVFRKVGKSTKESSNNYIGMYGLGRLSALGVSDTVVYTSVHNGKQYTYTMYRDGRDIKFGKLGSIDTDKPNGLSVKVGVEGSLSHWEEKIQKTLAYFENVKIVFDVEGWERETKGFADYKIKHYKNFSVQNLYNQNKCQVVLGQVTYPINFDMLGDNVQKLKSVPISLRFDIGELDMDASRENLNYSDQKTINNLENKISATIAELDGLAKIKCTGDYDDLNNYIEALKSNVYLSLLEGVNLIWNVEKNYTFKGVTYNESKMIRAWRLLKTNAKFNFSVWQVDDRISKLKSGDYEISPDKIGQNVYVSDLKIGNYAKAYLRENKYCKIYNVKLNYSSLRTLILNCKKVSSDIHRSKEGKLILREFIDWLKSLPNVNTIIDKTWVDEEKKARALARKQAKIGLGNTVISLAVYNNHGGKNLENVRVSSLRRKWDKYVVYGEKGDYQLSKLAVAAKGIFKVVAASKGNLKVLSQIENFVHYEDISIHHSFVRKIGTHHFLQELKKKLDGFSGNAFLKIVEDPLYEKVEELKDKIIFTNDYANPWAQKFYDMCKEKNWWHYPLLHQMGDIEKQIESVALVPLMNQIYSYGWQRDTQSILILNYLHTQGVYTLKPNILQIVEDFLKNKIEK